MTRRIVASFLAVLLALLVLVVVPLGARLSGQERRDFGHSADSAAHSLAALAEERLGDRTDAQDRAGSLRLPADAGDGVALLDRSGRQVAAAGRPVQAAVLKQVRASRRAALADAVVRTAVVGEPARPDGTVVLVRAAEPLDHRIGALWLGLAAAAAIALAVGAVIAVALAGWIARPLRDLHAVTVRMGHGDVGVRAADRAGAAEVRAVAHAFNEMAARIGSLLQAHRTMTADVSHQLRTPLAALRLRLELLADDAPENLRVDLQGALREIARLSRLADGLLAVARTEEAPSAPETVPLDRVVAERLDLWRPLASDRGVVLRSQVAPARARATPGNVEQVLDNLLANALDALDGGGHIDVRVSSEEREVELRVSDDGPGMPAHQRDRACARFVGGRSGGAHAGLGLAIVAGLVAADHGSTRLEETPGGGLSAVVRLPTEIAVPS